jgi:hypothetical protein
MHMHNLNEDQIKRQDFVDNEIYNLINRLNPSKREIDWDIGREVLRKPRLLGGGKGHNVEENTLPGSAALIWAGSFK